MGSSSRTARGRGGGRKNICRLKQPPATRVPEEEDEVYTKIHTYKKGEEELYSTTGIIYHYRFNIILIYDLKLYISGRGRGGRGK